MSSAARPAGNGTGSRANGHVSWRSARPISSLLAPKSMPSEMTCTCSRARSTTCAVTSPQRGREPSVSCASRSIGCSRRPHLCTTARSRPRPDIVGLRVLADLPVSDQSPVVARQVMVIDRETVVDHVRSPDRQSASDHAPPISARNYLDVSIFAHMNQEQTATAKSMSVTTEDVVPSAITPIIFVMSTHPSVWLAARTRGPGRCSSNK